MLRFIVGAFVVLHGLEPEDIHMLRRL